MALRNKNLAIQDYPHSTSRAYPHSVNSSLTRASRIIESLSQGLNTNVEIAAYCGYNTSTTHRLLKDMKQLGWVIQDDLNNRYYLGPFISRMAANALASHRFFVICALREMSDLSARTGEAINLAVMEGLHYLRIHEIPSRYDLRISDDPRGYGQIFAPGAAGKVLLSQLPDDVLRETLNKVLLVSQTDKSVTDRKLLYRQIREIRERGYAVSHSERIPGATGVSVPVMNYSWPAALTVIGPESRMQPLLELLTTELPGIAARISGNVARALKTPGAATEGREPEHLVSGARR
jgi:DNA-binding IclR family transcriptional regulator